MATSKVPTLDGSGKVRDKHLPSRLADAALSATYASHSMQPVNLKSIGGKGDGTDESAILSQALATGRPVYIPAGTWFFQNVFYGGSTSIYGDGNATVLVSHGQPILTLDPGYVGGGDYGSIERLRLTCDVDMAPGTALINLIRIRAFHVKNVNGQMTSDKQGTFFMFDTSYQISVDTCMLRTNRYGVGFELNSVTRPLEQQDTYSFRNVTCQGSHGVIVRSTNGNYNAIQFNGLKVVALAPESLAGYDEGLLTAAATAGATTLTVGTMVAGAFSAGDPVTVGLGTILEVCKVAAVNGSTVTLAAPLRFNHASGEPIFAHGFGVSLSVNTYDTSFQNCHIERVAIGILLNGSRGVNIDNHFNSASDMVRCTASERSVRIGMVATEGKPTARHTIVCIWASAVGVAQPPEVLLDGPLQIVGGASNYSSFDGQGQSLSGLNKVERVSNSGDGNDLTYTLSNVPGSNRSKRHLRLQTGASDVYVLTKGGYQQVNQLGYYRKAVTGTTTLVDGDPGYVGVTNTTAPRAITLPSASSFSNRVVIIKDETGGAAANNITVTAAGADTIQGSATFVINSAYGLLRLFSNGSMWLVI